MSWLDGLTERLRWLARPGSAERELSEEMRFHVDMETDKNVRAGMARDAARRAAERAFGEPSRTAEHVREERGIGVIEEAMTDLRYAVRTLRKQPAFTIAAVTTLALGIGANTAVFSVANGVLWRPLAFAEPDRLVAVWPSNVMSLSELALLRQHMESFQSTAAYAPWTMALTGVEHPTQLPGAKTSANLFATLGVRAAIGRTFVPGDDRPGAPPVVVISHVLWSTRFGGDPNAIGTSVVIDGVSHEIIGVMPTRFEVLQPTTQLWVPLYDDLDAWYYRANVAVVVARLRPDATLAGADREFQRLIPRMRAELGLPDSYGETASLGDFKRFLVGDLRTLLLVLLGAVGLILLIAGANLGNLLFARAVRRGHEVAMRTALGATRGRIVRQLLTESVLLSGIGGGLGLVVAYGGMTVLTATIAADTPRLGEVVVDRRVLAACAGFALFAGIVFSLAPAFALARRGAALRIGNDRVAGHHGVRPGRTEHVLIASQIALAVMLVVGAGLMLQTVARLFEMDPGFAYRDVLTLRVQPSGERYRETAARHAFYRTAFERIRALPGVRAVGAAQHLPLSGFAWGTDIEVEGRPIPQSEALPRVGYRIVTTGYFDALDIPLLAGRDFRETDDRSGERVAIINRTMARQLWPAESPIGRRLRQGREGAWLRIVGVVGDVHFNSLVTDPGPELFLPHRQESMGAMMVAVRTSVDPERLAGPVQDAIWAIDPDIPVSHVTPMARLLAASVGNRRFLTGLLAVFAVVALLLAMIGVYGVTAFTVGSRVREIGVRMALGASPIRVHAELLRQGMRRVAVGVVIGLAGALGLTRFLSGFVFGISLIDGVTYGSVTVLVFLVAAVAIALPASRATTVPPVTALRG